MNGMKDLVHGFHFLKDSMIKILIAGDYSPKDRISNIMGKKDLISIFDDIKPYFARADYSILNLEAPIVTDSACQPIKKAGPALKCSDKTIASLKYLGINCVTLANNHFRDYGTHGVVTTMKLCTIAGIDYVGAGQNRSEAQKVLYKKIGDYKIAIINCCEHEYSIASESEPGSNPLDPISQYYAIKEARTRADYVIVIVHGGIEHYQLPSPRMVSTYRFFIDSGADAVINHHQHCFSGYEVYKSKPIFYGIGNFCFDWVGKRDDIWNYGYLVNLILEKERVDFEIVPYEQCNNTPKVLPVSGDRATEIERQIDSLNRIIRDNQKLNDEYNKFLNRTSRYYKLSLWSNCYLKDLCNRGYLPSFVSSKVIRSLQNKIMCESHRDRLLHSIKHKLG